MADAPKRRCGQQELPDGVIDVVCDALVTFVDRLPRPAVRAP
jgi:hypothetical protein